MYSLQEMNLISNIYILFWVHFITNLQSNVKFICYLEYFLEYQYPWQNVRPNENHFQETFKNVLAYFLCWTINHFHNVGRGNGAVGKKVPIACGRLYVRI